MQAATICPYYNMGYLFVLASSEIIIGNRLSVDIFSPEKGHIRTRPKHQIHIQDLNRNVSLCFVRACIYFILQALLYVILCLTI